MPAVVSVVGNSGSGKTTLIEKLIRELKSMGYRVATIKHTPHGMTFDQPGKDSWRYMQAGSDATIISSRAKMVLIKSIGPNTTLGEIARVFGDDYDIILAEGFKRDNTPKIAVHRKETGTLPENIEGIIAVATDEPLATKTRQFSLNDARGLAELLREDFIETAG
ncbi:MAG: molybdopterin-guanine dinucleotide biosynthesis protein B [Chloroflexi bacterium]|nr:molybdopterin-guanine dinucleotide biosynthesis protein B [Chloroflexota bacterium]